MILLRAMQAARIGDKQRGEDKGRIGMVDAITSTH